MLLIGTVQRGHYPECRKTPLIRAWEMDLVLMTKLVAS
jgi:hypothetical protein